MAVVNQSSDAINDDMMIKDDVDHMVNFDDAIILYYIPNIHFNRINFVNSISSSLSHSRYDISLSNGER
jgi:hypothetical protein